MNAPTNAAELRLPPMMQGALIILREKGHFVEVRQNRNGSLRYRVDGSRERNALQTVNQFRHYGM